MASASSPTPMNRKNTSCPPKRGQIKVQIFENLVNAVVSAVSKAGKAGVQTEGTGGKSGSASTTPPESDYNSDTNSQN